MTEGPQARLLANRLNAVLAGQRLERVEWTNSLVTGNALLGRRVLAVGTHGKNILVHLNQDESFRIHLLMGGKIRIQRHEEPLEGELRLGLWTRDTRVAVVGAPKIELLSSKDLAKKMAALGPDPLQPNFDLGALRRNLQHAGESTLAECLLDQTIVAGVGNIWKSEILFEAGLDPRRKASSLGLAERGRLAKTTFDVMRRAYETNRAGNRNRFRMYHRGGKPCPLCESPIDAYRIAGRVTYSCPRCQR